MRKIELNKPNDANLRSERLKSEQNGSDFKQCPKSELFHNRTKSENAEIRRNLNIRISDIYCTARPSVIKFTYVIHKLREKIIL